MRKPLFWIKTVLVVIAVFVMSTNFIAQTGNAANGTISAAGADAEKAGIRMYKIAKPKHVADTDTIELEALLLDASQTTIGRWSKRHTGAGEGAIEETEMEFHGRLIKMTVQGRSVTLVVDGKQIYSGVFAPAGPDVAAEIERVGDLLKLMAVVGSDVNGARKEAEKLSRDWEMLSFVPRGLRPLALSLVSSLPTGAHLEARVNPELGCDTTAYPYCDDAAGEWRSQVCQVAKGRASEACSDWVNCLGCCAFDNCDCTCVNGDFLCWCSICGQRCHVITE